MNRKKRILFTGECSYLATGFGTYNNEVIKRLHATGEFEIAEIGSYASEGDPRNDMVPWKFYPVMPNPNDKEKMALYNSRPTFQFGEMVFDKVCLEFKPDIVYSITDYWMAEFIERSPFRQHFAFFHMPTVDGSPQKKVWLDMYRRCDKVFTYCNWGKKVLENESNKKIIVSDVISPGADIDVFKPVPNKKEHKQRCGLDPDSLIIGTVMRNQKRKLFYDLIEAFAMWINRSEKGGYKHLAKRAFLYLHTSYPDVGYDIAKAIQEFNISNKVIMTYMCRACGSSYPSFFSGAMSQCKNPNCKQNAAHPPNAGSHVSREVLAHIMNLFDVYVQYSICEGDGMPIREAKACGVPAMCVNYSAMEDHASSPGGFPINVDRFFYESVIETEQKRALPSNEHLCQQLTAFFKKQDHQRETLSKKTREFIDEPISVPGLDHKTARCGWDRVAALWAHHFREFPCRNLCETWELPTPLVKQPNRQIPAELDNKEFVNWAIMNILHEPKLVNTYWAYEWVQALNYGFRMDGHNHVGVDKQWLANFFIGMRDNINKAEEFRVSLLKQNNNNNVKDNVTFSII